MGSVASREDPEAIKAAREVAKELMAKGASAVVLFGSHVRGDAYPESDIDLVAIGEGPFYRLKQQGKYLASISWRTAEQLHEHFRKPQDIGGTIPGWQKAVILEDSEGIASSMQQEALEWDWEARWKSLEEECNSWVAAEITGLVEEVHRLVGNLRLGRKMVPAVQRSVLALHLAGILFVHHRLLYESENQVWELVSEKMGEPWASVQARGLGLGGEGLEETCEASLELFALAAGEVRHLLDEEQRQVVAHACELAGWRLGA